MLLRESSSIFPSSPLTPRPPGGLMTPTSPFAAAAAASHWPLLTSSASETFPNLSHLISQTNSVTLSPNPSLDSGHSPKQETQPPPPPLGPLYLANHAAATAASQNIHSSSPSAAAPNGSSNSDSEDSMERSPLPLPSTPTHASAPKSPGGGAYHAATPTSSTKDAAGGDAETPSTNGRLLWDFLQQLLNDGGQRYTAYIQWKNKETGVFKIVDPAGKAFIH